MRVEGIIKEFDANRGRGFIEYHRNPHIYFVTNDIQNYVAGKVKKGQKVSFETESDAYGIRARDVYLILKPGEMANYFFDRPDESAVSEVLYSSRGLTDRSKDDNALQPIDKTSDECVAFALIQGKIRLVSLTQDGKYRFLDQETNLHHILYVGISETLSLQRAITEFEDLINSKSAKESDFQVFFERNPDFILNEDYKHAHPHIVLSRNESGPLVPDFVLEPVDRRSFCDLLELKQPSSEIFVLKKNRMRYSAAVYEAAAQLRDYSRFFDEEINRKNFQSNNPGLRAFRPRMFVIIGRRGKEDPLLNRIIQTDHPDFYLRTYDDILARMRWKLRSK
jgi:cold shock CspA family protein